MTKELLYTSIELEGGMFLPIYLGRYDLEMFNAIE
jgi:hypothetical protein